MVDTVLIYATMWLVYGFEEIGYKEGASLNYGMMYGSLLLLTYTIVSSINIRLDSTVNQIKKYIIVLGIIAVASFFTFWQ